MPHRAGTAEALLDNAAAKMNQVQVAAYVSKKNVRRP
jgi:hypothetical protein